MGNRAQKLRPGRAKIHCRAPNQLVSDRARAVNSFATCPQLRQTLTGWRFGWHFGPEKRLVLRFLASLDGILKSVVSSGPRRLRNWIRKPPIRVLVAGKTKNDRVLAPKSALVATKQVESAFRVATVAEE